MYNKPSFFEIALLSVFLVFVVMAFGVVLAGIFAFLSGTIFYFTFNHGLVPLVSAAGGTVGGIGFWTAYFSVWFISVVGSLLKGASVTKNDG